jgi:hypothetical protein
MKVTEQWPGSIYLHKSSPRILHPVFAPELAKQPPPSESLLHPKAVELSKARFYSEDLFLDFDMLRSTVARWTSTALVRSGSLRKFTESLHLPTLSFARLVQP